MATAPQLPRAAEKFATSYREFAVLTPLSADTRRLTPSGPQRISQQCRVSKLLNLHNVNTEHVRKKSSAGLGLDPPKLLSLSQGQECCLCAAREAAAAQPSPAQPSPAQTSPAAHMCHPTSRRYVTTQPSPAQAVSGQGSNTATAQPAHNSNF